MYILVKRYRKRAVGLFLSSGEQWPNAVPDTITQWCQH